MEVHHRAANHHSVGASGTVPEQLAPQSQEFDEQGRHSGGSPNGTHDAHGRSSPCEPSTTGQMATLIKENAQLKQQAARHLQLINKTRAFLSNQAAAEDFPPIPSPHNNAQLILGWGKQPSCSTLLEDANTDDIASDGRADVAPRKNNKQV